MEYNNIIMIENDKDFIPIYKTEKGNNIVYGRELYKGLSVKQDFTDWIKKQLISIDAIKDKDYCIIWYKNNDPFKKVVEFKGNLNSMVKNGYSMEYILKLETAKEICLVAGASPRANKELKEKSKAYRRYLIGIEEKYKNNINNDIKLNDDMIRKLFFSNEENRKMMLEKFISCLYNNDILLDEIKQLRKEIEELNKKINILSDNQNRNSNIETSKINYKDENIIDDFNYSRFLNHINNLTDNTVLTKKEFLNLFNSYKFYHKEIGIMALNKFMNENNLIYGNDRLTDYARENNILTRDTYKNHNKVFFTKNGILYISNLLINNMHGDYKIKRK